MSRKRIAPIVAAQMVSGGARGLIGTVIETDLSCLGMDRKDIPLHQPQVMLPAAPDFPEDISA
jgi:hypothetical protein